MDYEGIYISDVENTFKMEYDFEPSEIQHNRNVHVSNPLNGRYPILTFGTQDFRSGEIGFIPLSEDQITNKGGTIDGKTERLAREPVIDFLKRGTLKVIRNDNGEMMIVGTHNIRSQSKGGTLLDISNVSFSYTEVGQFDFETMSKGGLLAGAIKSRYEFDKNGDVIWTMGRTFQAPKTHKRNTFSEVV